MSRLWGPCTMDSDRCLLLSCLLLLLKGLCSPFNIDEKKVQVFHGPPEAQFGYRVLQHETEGQKWMLVGAPWDGTADDRKGDVYRCLVGAEPNSTCTKVGLGDTALQNVSRQIRNMHFGMSLVESEKEGFVACAPLWSQECGTSAFSTGICTKVDSGFRPTENIAPTAQRCSTYMDIVIVLDGSNSIYPWYEVQKFLRNILSKFFISPEQIQVGVLQYAELAVHEWSLKDYQTSEEVLKAARNISRQEGRETRTAYAIRTACTEAFSSERGGRDGATRLMLVVTDGESHDGEELPLALAECEKRHITRYAIAVLGHYIRRQQDPDSFINEIKYIASDPDEKYFFNVTDEAALNDIVDALGDRIFSLEGTHGYNESSFELEMSQIGFSAHILEDGILFGIVGAYDWDGAVLKESRHARIIPPREAFQKEFPVELKNHAAYLGYTVSSVKLKSGKCLYVAGAPRFKHKGKVIVFTMSRNGSVTISQALTGEQIGSYFGSEVCPVDVNSDGVTDVLLVAAPMYLGAQHRETGRVYVYRLGQMILTYNGTLRADRKPQDSRFGYSLAAVPDLNHDGFNDVVVGAPLEDEHRGAVYVYHGHRVTVLPNYKQRVESSAFSQGLRYFGRSVTGQMDLDGDELVDLAIGAHGAAIVLRSRSIVQVNASIAVNPSSISVIQKNCQRQGKDSVCMSTTICFGVTSRSPGKWDTRFDVRYNVSLDDRKLSARAMFDENSQKLLQKQSRVHVGDTTCHALAFHVTDTSDYLRPVGITVRFALAESDSGPVLDERCSTMVRRMVPFFKDCGSDNVCITDLVLQARMAIAGTRQNPYIIRQGWKKLTVDILLENRKENAYNTSLRVWFSKNLHFASLSVKGESHPKVECTAVSVNSRVCGISYPVFRASAKVALLLDFEFSCSTLLNRLQIKLTTSSDSTERSETLGDNTAQLLAYVRYAPDLFISSESSLNRYEVRPSRKVYHGSGPEFRTTFRIQYLGCYLLTNLTAIIHLPAAAYGRKTFLSVTRVIADNATCILQNTTEAGRRSEHGVIPIHPEELLQADKLNCSNSWCETVTCQLQPLGRDAEITLAILRFAHDDFFTQAKFKSVKVVSELVLDARDSSVLFLEEAVRRRETVLEVIQSKVIPLSLWILIGSIIGGLLLLALIIFILWKLGFFTRKIQEEGKEEAEKNEE
ncbi:integrin alpha-10 [Rhinatrema bivittatum]|uniref:integrin alpha-10 n=1 Tax=Rhinatrema bivittatum TaxID=194408 RepID=UPI001126C61F|nr:integrin alpha-10 [Rhinatrema bivittatum]XP_029436076.1 integrin alpha-10 [Rhinatrema bivittatum]XP_029436078.1 integrin alpha-10 [Rhinatrema bivittatum]XP_029436079.1 integrin alpha-10 [Rhinatrema bivittatum]XP_029436080.1 integrin alpha-10 [Rhinatrema bivittatum]XP_029436081.1 integrin alpha-10 [Rhinatrema bivittatum]XP_029436082.1 integrin alpha-10 [Rhinatrema bivittatum]XP_029436083.1 integrin alpha-10 [Rhinatrema bivittatum]XP_029436084.1 integrin alpha-10 [Rhinatrema bivittatum]XP